MVEFATILTSLLFFMLLQVAGDEPCRPGNLVIGHPAEGTETQGAARVVTDGFLAMEGSTWNGAQSLVYQKQSSYVTVDLEEVRSIRALVVQGDDNDNYHIEGSADGVEWGQLWVAPPST